jgi:hypothetical protein
MDYYEDRQKQEMASLASNQNLLNKMFLAVIKDIIY